MSVELKPDNWVWVVVMDPETNPQYLGQQDEKTNLAYIPTFLEKEDAQQVMFNLTKAKGKKFEIQAIMFDQLTADAEANGFSIFVLNAEGQVIERLSPAAL